MSDAKNSTFDAATLESEITAAKASYNLKIFTFGIGDDSQSDYTKLKELSCAFDGMMMKMQSEDLSVLLTAMNGYEEYIATNA